MIKIQNKKSLNEQGQDLYEYVQYEYHFKGLMHFVWRPMNLVQNTCNRSKNRHAGHDIEGYNLMKILSNTDWS